jgi:PAS domain S-box-containing protein
MRETNLSRLMNGREIKVEILQPELNILEEYCQQSGRTDKDVVQECLNRQLSCLGLEAEDLSREQLLTEQKTLEAALLENQARYHAVLNAIPDLMLRVRRDGSCLDFLPPRISNSGTFLPVKQHLREVLPPELLQQQLEAIAQVLEDRQVKVYEHQLEKQGRVYYEEVRICPVSEDEVLLLIRDITEQKQAQSERDRFFNLSLDMLCIASFEGHFLRLNPAWEHTLGYSRAELIAKPYIDFVHPEDRARTLAEAQKLIKGVKTVQFENRYRCRDGSYRWLLWNAMPLPGEGVIYCVAHDITEHKQAEQEREKYYRQLAHIKYAIDQAAIVTITDAQGNISYINDKFSEISQYSPEELIGQNHRIMKSGYHSQEFYANLWATLKSGQIWRGEIKNKAKDGTDYWLDSTIVPFLDEAGKPWQYLALRTDVTARKQAEEALRQSQQQLSLITDSVPGGIAYVDAGRRYRFVNQIYEVWLDCPREEIIGKHIWEVLGEDTYNVGREHIDQVLRGKPVCFEALMHLTTGVSRHIYARLVPDWGDGGRVQGYYALITDISALKQAEESLRLVEENYRSIFENALQGIFQSTPDGHYLRVNPAMARIHGYESPEQMIATVNKIDQQIYLDPSCRNQFQRLLEEQGEVKNFQYQAYRRDGKKIWLEEKARAVRDGSGSLLYYEGMVEDITQRKQEEEELKRQVRKLLVEVDEQKRQQQVESILQTDYFQKLQAEVDNLRFKE